MNKEDVRIFFENYLETLKEINRLDVSVRTQRDWDTWRVSSRADIRPPMNAGIRSTSFTTRPARRWPPRIST